MNKASPNKETIRRICTLFGIQQCWMLNKHHTNTDANNDFIKLDVTKLLVDINPEKQAAFQQELYEWSGMDFAIYTLQSDPALIETIKQQGYVLLPLAKNSGLNAINKRIR